MSWIVRDEYVIETRIEGGDGRDARNLMALVQAAVRYHGTATVRLRHTATQHCSHCKAPRQTSELGPADCDQPGDIPGLPVCCDQAQAEYRARRKAGAA